MIEFESSFFIGETRNDFYIDETMKHFWAAHMEVVVEIERICNKYGLTYYADWGTLLGAIRHKGWVHWDDDMDICMMRPDYEKLIQVLPQELSGEYAFNHLFGDETYGNYMLKIANSTCISDSAERMKQFHGCPFSVIIDVFPLDVIPRDKDKAALMFALFDSIVYAQNILRGGAKRISKESEMLAQILQKLQEVCGVEFDFNKSLENQLWRLSVRLNQLYQMRDGDYVTTYPLNVVRKGKLILDKKWYAGGERMPFENITVNVPKKYDKVLTCEYGDYMIPVRGTAAHTYPAYMEQLKELREQLVRMEVAVEKMETFKASIT